MFQYLWSHKWIFWPAASLTYLAIGIVFGLVVYYRYERHEASHKEFERCWCCSGPDWNFLWLFGAVTSFLLWPLYLVGVILYRLVGWPLIFVVRIVVRLYETVGHLAHWDGKTIENAHPTARALGGKVANKEES